MVFAIPTISRTNCDRMFQSINFMKKQTSFIIIFLFFGLYLSGQEVVFPNDILVSTEHTPEKFYSDTAITSAAENSKIDGFRTEIDSDGTGAKKADKIYQNLGFKASVSKYLNELDGQNLSQDQILRIANSFRLNSQTEEAEYWYSQVITEDSGAKFILRYAQVLQSNGKCEDATRWYKKFKKVASRKERKNRDFIIDCEDLKNIKNHETVKLKNVRALNTGHLDFSPIPYRDGVIFSSTRKNNNAKKVIDSWTNDNFSDLFYAAYDEEVKRFKRPVPLTGDLNKQFHDGVATFDQSGSVMFFTRNNNNGKSESKAGLVDLKIYVAYLDEDYWTNVQELPFNSDEYTSCHPTLSADGKRLYFASNRPGGYGGLDIYVAEQKGGIWQRPRNLGPMVNSAGNELFPVIHEEENLYYSSNGHRGLGGLDIFVAKKSDLEDESSWNFRENLGTPFNSEKDDFGFVLVGDDRHTGFLTSNREGGKGKDDIYTWTMDGSLEEDGVIRRAICVYDAATGERLDSAYITVAEKKDSEAEEEQLMLTLQPLEGKPDKYILGVTGRGKTKTKLWSYETDNEGIFNYQLAPGKRYEVKVERKGYEETIVNLNYAQLKRTKDFCIPMNKPNCKLIEGLVVNKKYDTAMPLATVEVWNKCTNQKDEFTTDEKGNFELCVPCDCEYRIYARKAGFESDVSFVSTIDLDCQSEQTVKAKLALDVRKAVITPTVPDPPITTRVTEAVRTVPITTYKEVITYVPTTKLVPTTTYVPISELVDHEHLDLAEGQVISLKDIYYDFDKFNIREDASIDLTYVYQMMVKYPSLEIELMSHTDARGTQKYNEWLSSNRAKSARSYLIKKGIAASRLKAKGYGESMLKNRCADGVDCTEEEHQANRRTEVKVLKFNAPNTSIQQH